MKREEEIREALLALGYPESTIAITMEIGQDREAVFVDGEVVGIWDFRKHTFID